MARDRAHVEGSGRSLWGVVGSMLAWMVYLFLMLPSVIVVPMSFSGSYGMEFPPRTYSTILYQIYFTSGDWLDSTLTSLYIAVGTTCLSLLLGVPAAFGLSRGERRVKSIIAIFLLSPILIPPVVMALGMYIYFSYFGFTGNILAIIIAHTVLSLPFVVIICMAGLRHVDPSIEVAATIMGASSWQSFRRVTVPLLKPTIFAAGLFAFLISFDELILSFFIARADALTLPVRMFSSIRWEISPVIAAISTMLTLLSCLICVSVAFIQGFQGRR